MKTIEEINFQEIQNIPDLIKDFLSEELLGFEDEVFNIQNIKSKIEAKKKFSPQQRQVLYDALKSQLSKISLTKKQIDNLEFLKENHCFTITTGHQLNLFTGPSFFIYKIIQTIKTSEFLKAEFPDLHFVPIFWMATEDHDFEEINHFNTTENYYHITEADGGAVGRIKVSDQAFIKDFEKEFQHKAYGPKLIDWLYEAYALGNTLAEATRILVQNLFGKYGLLMLDGDDASLKSEMVPVFQKELEAQQLKTSTAAQRDFLNENYGKVQVNPREINLFYLNDSRKRIDYDGKHYFIIDTPSKLTRKNIISELHNYPERFSPNALLRPVYQESILPNIAYIGGNAEIMYWIELKEYFHNLDLPFPVLIPRNSMLFLNNKIVEKTEKLNLQPQDFFGEFTRLINKRLMQDHRLLELLNKNKLLIETAFNELKEQSALTDKSFRNLVEAEETRQLKSYHRMEKRLIRAEKIRNQDTVDRMKSLYNQIHPGGVWQERIYNFSVFFSDWGWDWIDSTYEAMDVKNSKLIMVQV